MLEKSILLDGQEGQNVMNSVKRVQKLSVLITDLKKQIKELELSKQLKQAETELKELSEPIFKEYGNPTGTQLVDIAGHGSFEITVKVGGETVAFSTVIRGNEKFAKVEKLLRDNGLVNEGKDVYKFGMIDLD